MPELNPRKMQVSIFLVNRISVQLRCGSAKRQLPLRALTVGVRLVREERVEEYARGAREALPPPAPPPSPSRRHGKAFSSRFRRRHALAMTETAKDSRPFCCRITACGA